MRLEDLPRGVRVRLRADPEIEGVIVLPDGKAGWAPSTIDPDDKPVLDDWFDEEGCVWVLWALQDCHEPLPYTEAEIEIPSVIDILGDLGRLL